ncbi:MarR family transcriptional regulator [Streptomyces lomondensis]|uniref:MarR family transcriptional regulator n=2 Tax=Streptomyces lomondensis TaxID=68229 RepID=A0ABQ2X026_9ACTN|nr:MarR family transcriptional regulator [Streptomyces lomondensis]
MGDMNRPDTNPDGSPTLPPNFAKSIGFLLNKAGQLLTAQFESELAPYGLSARNWGVLRFIDVNGNQSQQSIGEQLRIDRSTMVNLVDELERMGYVVRLRDPHDRRRYAVTLTEYGRRQLRSGLDSVEDKVTDRFLERISEQDRERLVSILISLVAPDGITPPGAG